jgi:hypothetical protein
MNFDLDRLGPQEFERLIQALALVELGNGVQIFGQGKDGGREATFDGEVNFPRGHGDLWNGYGVVQAKHREFPAQSPRVNANWLIAELDRELGKFQKHDDRPAVRRPKPNYYLIATNVRLAPEQGAGGLDRVNARLAEWEDELELSGTHVWHHANISRMLEAHEGIRRAFAGFITTGDVLARLIDYFPGSTSDVPAKMRVHAAQQLRAKKWVRLSESGVTDTDKSAQLLLSDVGIDLPGRLRVLKNDDMRAEDEQILDVRVVEYVIEQANANLRNNKSAELPPGVVLVGGPGQGKSTLGHLICQAYRVALLAELDGPPLGSNIDELVVSWRAHMEDINIQLPHNKRWPVYVELAKFGDAIAGDPALSLMKYIASEISRNGIDIKTNELERWRHSWPWLVVLDGLDEVAALENRQSVIDRVSDFVLQSNGLDSDVYTVATTRPQGYHGEFAEFEPQEIQLRDLTAEEAVSYGIKVSSRRHVEDPDLLASVVTRLKDAAKTSETARLMRSPLQVTIIATILERSVRVPTTKHALFDTYYNAIYTRETGKATRRGILLFSHREDVDYVHERVGLLLQARAETQGEADALLADTELHDIFKKRIDSSGFDGAVSAKLAQELMDASRERVVLLVGAEQDFVGFEVRALQEYMAARALTTGTDADVLNSLDAISPSSFWRNTLLLAIGRLFAGREHIRDGLLGRMAALDVSTAGGAFAGFGERLALDLLDDEIALAVPNFRRTLLAQALLALRRWPTSNLQQLAKVTTAFINGPDRQAAQLAKRHIEEALESPGRARLSAYILLSHWRRQPGAAGAFATRLLARHQGSAHRAIGVGGAATAWEYVASHVPTSGLSSEQRALRRKMQKVLSDRTFSRGLSLDLLASHAQRPADVQEARVLQEALSDDELLRRVVVAVDSLDITEGSAAIWLSKIVAVVLNRRPVAQSIVMLHE